MFSKFSLSLLVVLAVMAIGADAKHVDDEKRDCSNSCISNFRCNPYAKEVVWAIADNYCRVFQNGCLFQLENCQRENECKSKLTSIAQEECKPSCPSICPAVVDPVCASFAQVNAAGENVVEQKTFSNACLLSRHACENGEAYLNEPTPGACN